MNISQLRDYLNAQIEQGHGDDPVTTSTQFEGPTELHVRQLEVMTDEQGTCLQWRGPIVKRWLNIRS